MDNQANDTQSRLGNRLKSIRRTKGITLQQVADGAGLSKSLISQIETGSVNPSIASLKRIGDFLQVSMGELFEDSIAPNGSSGLDSSGPAPADFVHLVKKDRRKILVFPVTKNESFMLTGDVQHDLEVMLTTMKPGTSSGEEVYAHSGEELAWLLEGSLEVTVGEQQYLLEEGDSIHFASSLPHHYRVLGEKVAKFVAVITPPSF